MPARTLSDDQSWAQFWALARWAVLTLTLIFSTQALGRENVSFKRLSINSGLSQESVNAITQDRSGFIWVGTQEGLNRFDGRQFQVFLHDPDNPRTLPNDWINDLLVLRSGDLWAATGDGLAVYDPRSNEFRRPAVPSPKRDSAISSVRTLAQDGQGNVWIGSDSAGLLIFDPATGSLSPIQNAIPDFLIDAKVVNFAPGANGRMWVIAHPKNPTNASLGLYSWSPDSQVFSPFEVSRPMEGVAQVALESDGQLWVGFSDAGLMKVSLSGGEPMVMNHRAGDHYSLSSNRIITIDEDAEGRLWVGTDKGLNLWDSSSGRFHRYRADPNLPTALSDDRITSMFSDSGGVFWVGTYSGVNRWNARLSVAEHFRGLPDEPGTLSSNIVTSITTTSDGDVLVGTFGGGLNRRRSGGMAFTHIGSGTQPIALPDDRVMSLAVDPRDRVLIGTRSAGLVRLALDSAELEIFSHDPNDDTSLSANAITAILVANNGEVWVCTFGGGVNRLLPNGEFERFSTTNSGLGSDRVVAAAQDSVSGNIWFATHNAGVSIFDPSSGAWRTLGRSNGLASDAIVALGFTNTHAWIGTRDAGVLKVSLDLPAEGAVAIDVFNRRHGLASNAVMGLVVDADERVWLATNRGINVVDANLSAVRRFNVVHGLQGWDFNSGAFHQGRDGELYFGGNNGFNRFDPQALFEAVNEFSPPVVLTGVSVMSESRQFDVALPALDSIELTHGESVVGFEFAALDFTEPEEIRYRYRMAGLETEWNDVGESNRAFYSNLPFGETLQFQVQATNSDGLWSQQEISLGVTVSPPPWRTLWAYIAYAVALALLALACGLSIARRARRQSQRRAARKLKMYLRCLDQATESVAIIRDQGDLVYYNRAGEPMFNDPDSVVAQLFRDTDSRAKAMASVARDGHWQTTVRDDRSSPPTWFEVSLTDVELENDGKAVVVITQNVTRQKLDESQLRHYRDELEALVKSRTQQLEKTVVQQQRAEDNLRVSLKEKEVLIKEVHHRVKNNMQVITSLLRLQAGETEDEAIRRMLAESENRIHSMALIHESLYQSDNLLDIDFQDYLSRLTSILNRMYRQPSANPEIRIDAQRVQLDIESAVPCGLIVNELVSNAMKHAFKGIEHPAVVSIVARPTDDGQCQILVKDNGCGYPENVDFRQSPSLGMEIVCILTEQLGGTIEMRRDGGTTMELRFPFSLRPEAAEVELAASA